MLKEQIERASHQAAEYATARRGLLGFLESQVPHQVVKNYKSISLDMLDLIQLH